MDNQNCKLFDIQGVAMPNLDALFKVSIVSFSWLLTSEKSSAHLIQAQRDYFGAHTYQRIDKPSSDYFTTNWTTNG